MCVCYYCMSVCSSFDMLNIIGICVHMYMFIRYINLAGFTQC